MKKLLLVLLICLFNYSVTLAQDDTFKEDTIKLTKLSNDAVEASFGQLYGMIPAEKLEEFKKDLKPIMEIYYSKVAEISMEFYTHEDVKRLLEFYESELGQKLLENQTKLTAKTLQMGQELSMEIMPLIQKYSN